MRHRHVGEAGGAVVGHACRARAAGWARRTDDPSSAASSPACRPAVKRTVAAEEVRVGHEDRARRRRRAPSARGHAPRRPSWRRSVTAAPLSNSSRAWMVVGVLTGIFSPARGFELIVRSLAGDGGEGRDPLHRADQLDQVGDVVRARCRGSGRRPAGRRNPDWDASAPCRGSSRGRCRW